MRDWFRADPRRILAVAFTSVCLAALVYELCWGLLNQDLLPFTFGGDYNLYRNAASDWLHGGGFYLPRQLGGSYEIAYGDRLYPPTSLLLFVPFALLPEPLATILWWTVPLGITGLVLVRLRPSSLVWPVLALCITWPSAAGRLGAGNPVMWSVAALAAGTVWAWPAPLAGLKITLSPFALFGIWRRAWWLGLGVLVALSIPFAPMWPDYVRAIADSHTPQGPFYSIGEWPLMVFPLVAWAASTRPGAGVAGWNALVSAADRIRGRLRGERGAR